MGKKKKYKRRSQRRIIEERIRLVKAFNELELEEEFNSRYLRVRAQVRHYRVTNFLKICLRKGIIEKVMEEGKILYTKISDFSECLNYPLTLPPLIEKKQKKEKETSLPLTVPDETTVEVIGEAVVSKILKYKKYEEENTKLKEDVAWLIEMVNHLEGMLRKKKEKEIEATQGKVINIAKL